MRNIKSGYDTPQISPRVQLIFLDMLLSKTFGYALRSIIYMEEKDGNQEKTNLQEISEKLNIPRHFLAKVLKRLVNEGILTSTKGPNGGFGVNPRTRTTTLLRLAELSGEMDAPDKCVLYLGKCNSLNPCVLHVHSEKFKESWHSLLETTTIADLLSK